MIYVPFMWIIQYCILFDKTASDYGRALSVKIALDSNKFTREWKPQQQKNRCASIALLAYVHWHDQRMPSGVSTHAKCMRTEFSEYFVVVAVVILFLFARQGLDFKRI